MGVSAAVVVAATGVYSAHEAREARKQAEEDAKEAREAALAEERKAQKQAEEEAAKLAASTPTGSMSTSKRIAAQREMQLRRAGTGRQGTVLNKQAQLG